MTCLLSVIVLKRIVGDHPGDPKFVSRPVWFYFGQQDRISDSMASDEPLFVT